MSDIVVVFREVYQKNVPFVATMLCIIFPKVGEQPLTSEISPFSVCETLDRLLNHRIEIRANAIRIGSVVVVRITVVVDIGEIGSGIRDYPLGEPT